MADDDRAAQIARIEQIERIKSLEAKQTPPPADPDQPGVGAIGSNASPPVAQAQEKDWVDKLKDLPGQISQIAMKSRMPQAKLLGAALNPTVQNIVTYPARAVSGLISTGLAGAAGTMTKENPVSMGDFVDAARGQAPGWGELAMRMGQPNPGVNVPWTNGKKVTLADLENALGNVVGGAGTSLLAKFAGSKFYASANKNLDMEAQAMGKNPVTPVLKKYGVRGDEATRVQAMENIGNKLSSENASIENAANDAGGEIDMNKAVAPAQDYVDSLKKQYTVNGVLRPDMVEPIAKLQNEIDVRKSMAAVEPQARPVLQPDVPGYLAEREMTSRVKGVPYDQNLTELTEGPIKDSLKHKAEKVPVINDEGLGNHVTQEPQWTTDAQGNWVKTSPEDELRSLSPGTRMEMTERKPGPNVTQGRQWKTADATKANFESTHGNSNEENLFKASAAGHRLAVEDAIEKSVGPEAAAKYSANNDELGSIITTADRAQRDAMIEGRKNTLTQVKAGALAHGNVREVLAAQLAKLLNKVDARSTLGYNLETMAPAIGVGAAAANQKQQNPWSQSK